MKVYVLRIDPKNAEPGVPPKFPMDNQEIRYSREPEWRMTSIEANSWCRSLNNMGVHIGPHYCTFTVEELPTGECAIVCPSHPDDTASESHGPR
jgi:hypothetical protein